MEISYITILGLAAATCTTVSFFPQVLKIWKSKCARDISLVTFTVLATGVFLWFVYGIFIKDLPVILANGITFILVAAIALFKIKYRI